ncbi:putative transferase, protein kinase RLK-Pelle-LRR-III family [Rosa chinensis]|uniref:Putative transferase, protein kinase RLK-Pelle-LRR-III family n=1 Tax=Rosa chinensis TaxID=74649 RepID=A0A2P6P680_ROSCH|nr:putative receptor-like protein kinase At1g80870 [Rosa chinensis]PRQ17448.1 putative transferase, protein kinase RLK-Pelle-LRR-III family [Rosa chinensis]
MLSRALTVTRKSPKDGDYVRDLGCSKSGSFNDYEDCIVGFMEDLPLVHCDHDKKCVGCVESLAHLTLRGVLRGSVGVIGESRLAMTEKVVLLGGRVCAVKRFRQVRVGRREFGKRIQRLAEVSRKCEFLVPVTAYLFAKRIKFVLSDYRPMGSLADLLAGARDHGHTALVWNQRLTIIFHISRAISFIHTQHPPYQKNMMMHIHGSIKASNVLVNIDFSACLSDYGFTQLAEQVEIPETWQVMKSPFWLVEETNYSDELNQKADIYNFGVILLDVLAGSRGLSLMKKGAKEKKEAMKFDGLDLVEFGTKDAKERRQVSKVFDIAVACTNAKRETRPTIDEIYNDIVGIM